MAKINLLDFLTAGDKIYTGGQVYEVRKKQILAVIEESINTLADDANLSYDKAKEVWEYLRYFKDTEDLYDCIEDYIDLICIINLNEHISLRGIKEYKPVNNQIEYCRCSRHYDIMLIH